MHCKLPTYQAIDRGKISMMTVKPIVLTCDRCSREQLTARSYKSAGVCYILCAPCREELERTSTPERPRDPRDTTLDWLF